MNACLSFKRPLLIRAPSSSPFPSSRGEFSLKVTVVVSYENVHLQVKYSLLLSSFISVKVVLYKMVLLQNLFTSKIFINASLF